MTKTSKAPKANRKSKKTADFRVSRTTVKSAAVTAMIVSAFAAGRRWKRTQKVSNEA